ncbi:MAG: TonB-dependent receptor, partial [Saprospiraceae bacterium]|nr:TonB-dependent receptor [Saprospiraceae bacterium]
ITLLLFSVLSTGYAQVDSSSRKENFQVIRGAVLDGVSGQPIEGASVELMNYMPRKKTTSNQDGSFRLEGIPVGRHRVLIEKNGYAIYTLSNVMVASGKEVVENIAMDELVQEESTKLKTASAAMKQRSFNAYSNRTIANNKMALASVEPFTIEEIQRYSGCLNDPSRLASSFTGIFNTDDSQNFIVNRGNSPVGVSFVIDGVHIDNPNHFGTMGNTGSSFQILNTGALGNSELIRSAFPAEYGDSFSAIYNMSLRKGNNQRFEFTGRASLLGGELIAEGPIQKGNSSFLVAYRYSLLRIISILPIDIGTASTPNYQDINFKLYFPTKNLGEFTLFGLGGLSDVALLNEYVAPSDLFSERNRDLYIKANMGTIGFKHKKYLNPRIYLETTLHNTYYYYRSHRDTVFSNGTKEEFYKVRNDRNIAGISFLLNAKVSRKLSYRTGIRGRHFFLNIFDRFLQKDLVEYYFIDHLFDVETYAQFHYKVSDRLVFNIGIRGQYYSLNNKSYAIEPRFALRWNIAKRHSLSFGYGWHSKRTPFTLSFFQAQNSDGSYNRSNQDLGFGRSHHLNLLYKYHINQNWLIQTEVYGQYLTDLVVSQDPSSLSLVNFGHSAFYPKISNLTNAGLAYNCGIELTIRKSFSGGYYGSLGGSYFESKYQGSDGIWRDTRFATKYIVQLVAGKEFKIGKRKQNVLTLDIRGIHHGARPFIPIDLAASIANGYEILDAERAFQERLTPYTRIDAKIGVRFNHRHKRLSHYIYLDAINVGMFKNELQRIYNSDLQAVVSGNQFGLVPNLFYQLQF